MDYKIKLLNENGFTYTGDKYTHSESGFDIWCKDIRYLENDEFKNKLEYIINELKILEAIKLTSFEILTDFINTLVIK